jgi:hypothetical protein
MKCYKDVETELRIACFTGEKALVFNLVGGKTHGDHRSLVMRLLLCKVTTELVQACGTNVSRKTLQRVMEGS